MEKQEDTSVLFCSHCGKPLKDKAEVCLNCGTFIKREKSDGITLGIIGLFLMLTFPLLALLVSGIGYSHAVQRSSAKGIKLNLIALCVSPCATIIYLIISFI